MPRLDLLAGGSGMVLFGLGLLVGGILLIVYGKRKTKISFTSKQGNNMIFGGVLMLIVAAILAPPFLGAGGIYVAQGAGYRVGL